MRALAAGDELFCVAGTLQLQTSALPGIDTLPGLQLRLQVGQGWRAPAPLLLQITAVNAPARLRCTAAAVPVPAPAATPWTTRAGAWFRSWRPLRA